MYVEPVINMELCLMLLLVAKCCFNRTFVADKKSLYIFLTIFLIQELNVMTGKGIPWFRTLCSFLDFFWIFVIVFRGGKGWIKRALSVLEVGATFLIAPICLCGFIVTIVMPSLPEETMTEYSDMLVTVFCVVILIYVYVVLYRKGIYFCFKKRERVVLILFDLYIFMLFSLTLVEAIDTGTIYMESWIKYVFVIMMAVFYFVFLGVLLKNRMMDYYKRGQAYQQEWMERELRHFTEYKRAEEETKRFRHDMINNLACVETLMQEGKMGEAKAYVEALLGTVKELSPKVVTGDEMLDCIISSKWDIMQEAGILFTIDGVLDRGLTWQPIDICTVFANALDNAIEACMQVEGDRRISLTCKHT